MSKKRRIWNLSQHEVIRLACEYYIMSVLSNHKVSLAEVAHRFDITEVSIMSYYKNIAVKEFGLKLDEKNRLVI